MKLNQYSLQAALDDGVLIDVSDLAEQAGLRYPVFVTSAFFNSSELKGSKLRVVGALECVMLQQDCDARKFGTRIYNKSPRPGMGAWIVSMRVTIAPSEASGVIVFIAEREGEEIDFTMARTAAGGSFYVV